MSVLSAMCSAAGAPAGTGAWPAGGMPRALRHHEGGDLAQARPAFRRSASGSGRCDPSAAERRVGHQGTEPASVPPSRQEDHRTGAVVNGAPQPAFPPVAQSYPSRLLGVADQAEGLLPQRPVLAIRPSIHFSARTGIHSGFSNVAPCVTRALRYGKARPIQ